MGGARRKQASRREATRRDFSLTSAFAGLVAASEVGQDLAFDHDALADVFTGPIQSVEHLAPPVDPADVGAGGVEEGADLGAHLVGEALVLLGRDLGLVEVTPGQLGLEHVLDGHLGVLDPDVEPAAEHVHGVGSGLEHNLAVGPCLLDQQEEAQLSTGVPLGVVGVGHRECLRVVLVAVVEESIEHEGGHLDVLVFGAVGGGDAGQLGHDPSAAS